MRPILMIVRATLIASVAVAASASAQQRSMESLLPDAPTAATDMLDTAASSSSAAVAEDLDTETPDPQSQAPQSQAPQAATPQRPAKQAATGTDGKPIPLNQQQPQRILGIMPNFRSVSGGSVPHPPGWRYNFKVATRQSFDYSSFVFLGLTSISAEGIDSHPKLGKGIGGLYAYTWRGLLDKTDGTYLQAWLLSSLLHEDTRFYALGHGSLLLRSLYVISRQGVTRTYGGHQTPNFAGLGGKVLTQVISRNYYPAGSSDFSVLATKFAYSAMRDIAFSTIREFYPDIAAHYIRKHREKLAAAAAAQPQGTPPAATFPH